MHWPGPSRSGAIGHFVLSGAILSLLVCAAHVSGIMAMVGPFSATCALLVLTPKAPSSQPRSILWAHVICLGVGAAMSLLHLPVLPAVLLGAWLSILSTGFFRAAHPPAIAHTVILSLGSQNVGKYLTWAIAMVMGFTLYALFLSRTKEAPNPSLGINP
jgi:CBS-domain-containing membrane protein